MMGRYPVVSLVPRSTTGYRLSSLRDEEAVTVGCTASEGGRSGEEVVAAAEE
jgi:hypothetical protein